MGPKWILARVRQYVATYPGDSVDWNLVPILALRPTVSGRPINHLSAHAAICALKDAQKHLELCIALEKAQAIAAIDLAIRILDGEEP
jgi:hypothetical protein